MKLNKPIPHTMKRGRFFSPEDVKRLLVSRRWGERSEAHHFGWVPQRLLQVAPLDVTLEIGQAQHSQVHRVCSNTRQPGPLLFSSHNPVVMWVGVVLVILEVITCGVWIWDCVGLKTGGRQGEFKYQ